MDVVKSRIQNSPKVAGQTPKYNWAWGACGTVMKVEGFGALYKGFLPKVLRLGPVSFMSIPPSAYVLRHPSAASLRARPAQDIAE